MRLSACMIVRDVGSILPQALASLKPWVDELIVVDTGSVDDTVEIARRFGARVFHFPWRDDFSAARNESLSHAHGEWIFWMDSDDVLDEVNGRKLRALADGPHESEVFGYAMQVHCPSADDNGDMGVTIVDHVKLFRNLPGLRFEGRIHEQVLMPIRRLGGDVRFTDIFVVHANSDHSKEGRARKIERDLRILNADLAERPDHPFVLFNLGMTYADIGRHEEAVASLYRCIELMAPGDSPAPKAYCLLIGSLCELERWDEALETCRKAVELFQSDAEVSFRAGHLLSRLNRLPEAAEAYRRALRPRRSERFSSFDPGILGYKARYNLAQVERELGRLDSSELQCRLALEEHAAWRPGLRLLTEILLAQGRQRSVEVETEELLDAGDELEAALMQAMVDDTSGERTRACDRLSEIHRRQPKDVYVLEKLCRTAFFAADLDFAESCHLKLVALEPKSAAAHYHLAHVRLSLGKSAEAIMSLEESLRLAPHSVQARSLLDEARRIASSV